jgi:hypothetical protein
VCVVAGEEEPEMELQIENYIERVMFWQWTWKLKPADPAGTVCATASSCYFERNVCIFLMVKYGWMSPRNGPNAGHQRFTCTKVYRKVIERFIVHSVPTDLVQFSPPKMMENCIY